MQNIVFLHPQDKEDVRRNVWEQTQSGNNNLAMQDAAAWRRSCLGKLAIRHVYQSGGKKVQINISLKNKTKTAAFVAFFVQGGIDLKPYRSAVKKWCMWRFFQTVKTKNGSIYSIHRRMGNRSQTSSKCWQKEMHVKTFSNRLINQDYQPLPDQAQDCNICTYRGLRDNLGSC